MQLEELEKERKKDRKKQKEKNIRKATIKQLIRKLPKDFEAIIEENFKVVAGAYRKSVTSNAFGKKNYDKFLPQLQEYLTDNSNILDIDYGICNELYNYLKNVYLNLFEKWSNEIIN